MRIRTRLLSRASAVMLGITGVLSAQTLHSAAPEVRLEVHGGKSQFYIGDLVVLDLVFRNLTSNPYWLNGLNYGDIGDKVDITPVRGWLSWQSESSHDYVTLEPLLAAEVRVPILLNQGYVFREPGHYEVQVTTARLEQGTPPDTKRYGPVTTNTVGIDLAPMSAEIEAERVKSLTAEIDGADTTTQGNLTRMRALARLTALGGDEALYVKMRLILAHDWHMQQMEREALSTTRNLPLQLKLLEQAWNDPQREPTLAWSEALKETRLLMRSESLPGWTMLGPKPDEKEVEEHEADMEALIRSLPQRSGRSRTAAINLLMQDRTLSPADLAMVKPVALEEFEHMSVDQQHILLRSEWEKIRDASLATDLRAMLDKEPTDWIAIQRLIELDPVGAKADVVRAVCAGEKKVVPVDAVGALPAETLPEVDGCLGNLVRVPPPNGGPDESLWQIRVMLAARFATPAILPDVRAGWKRLPQDSAVIAVLLRYAPAEAVAKIQSAPTEQLQNLLFPAGQVFKELGAPFPLELLKWLRQRLTDGTDDDAGLAAFELSAHGAPEDRVLIEARLAKLRAKWSSRAKEVAAASDDVRSPAGEARGLEEWMMIDLRDSKLWTLSDAEAENLTQACLTDSCRKFGKSPQAEALQ